MEKNKKVVIAKEIPTIQPLIDGNFRIEYTEAIIELAQLLNDSFKNEVFVYVDFENFIKNGENIMAHAPVTEAEAKLKVLLNKAIAIKIDNFYCTKIDPSLSEDGEKIIFEAGKRPAVGKTYSWWKKKAEQYLPERKSRLGTELQYVAFLGVLMQKLVEEGMSVATAWHAVCVDSKHLGHYDDSIDAKNYYETTGSRHVCGFCDLANVYKILTCEDMKDSYMLASGCYKYCGSSDTLSNLEYFSYGYFELVHYNGVGWIVCS